MFFGKDGQSNSEISDLKINENSNEGETKDYNHDDGLTQIDKDMIELEEFISNCPLPDIDLAN